MGSHVQKCRGCLFSLALLNSVLPRMKIIRLLSKAKYADRRWLTSERDVRSFDLRGGSRGGMHIPLFGTLTFNPCTGMPRIPSCTSAKGKTNIQAMIKTPAQYVCTVSLRNLIWCNFASNQIMNIVGENVYVEFWWAWWRDYFFLAEEHGDWLQGEISVSAQCCHFQWYASTAWFLFLCSSSQIEVSLLTHCCQGTTFVYKLCINVFELPLRSAEYFQKLPKYWLNVSRSGLLS